MSKDFVVSSTCVKGAVGLWQVLLARGSFKTQVSHTIGHRAMPYKIHLRLDVSSGTVTDIEIQTEDLFSTTQRFTRLESASQIDQPTDSAEEPKI